MLISVAGCCPRKHVIMCFIIMCLQFSFHFVFQNLEAYWFTCLLFGGKHLHTEHTFMVVSVYENVLLCIDLFALVVCSL